MKNHIKINSIKNLHILPIVMLLIIGGSCEKETYMVPESFKQYFYFPAGSWWIYKSQANNFDTISIKSIKSEMRKAGAESCDKIEKITIEYESSIVGNSIIRTNYNGQFVLCCDNLHNYFNELADFTKDVNKGNKIHSCHTIVESWIVDSIIVNNDYYYHVVLNKTDSNFIFALSMDYPIKCYFKENIGLIKRELKNGEIWELVDYKINK